MASKSYYPSTSSSGLAAAAARLPDATVLNILATAVGAPARSGACNRTVQRASFQLRDNACDGGTRTATCTLNQRTGWLDVRVRPGTDALVNVASVASLQIGHAWCPRDAEQEGFSASLTAERANTGSAHACHAQAAPHARSRNSWALVAVMTSGVHTPLLVQPYDPLGGSDRDEPCNLREALAWLARALVHTGEECAHSDAVPTRVGPHNAPTRDGPAHHAPTHDVLSGGVVADPLTGSDDASPSTAVGTKRMRQDV
jgi:hypothetical protein